MVGSSQGHDRAVTRGDTTARKYSTFYFRGGLLTGTDSINDPAGHLVSRKMIGAGSPLTPEQAGDTSVDLRSIANARP